MRLPPEQLWTVILALRAIGDWDRARFAAQAMLESVAGDDQTAQRLRLVARTFLGEAMERDPEKRDDLVRAEQLYRDTLADASALAKELDTPEARRDVSVSLDNVANAARAKGDLAAAERLFAESLDISRALAKELDTPEARRDLAIAFVNMAGVAEEMGEVVAVRDALLEARTAASLFGQSQSVSDAASIIAFVDNALRRLS
jgi:hypothetical protein